MLLAVFCSVVASAATCFVIIRFSLVNPAAQTAATVASLTTPAPSPAPKRTKPVVPPDQLIGGKTMDQILDEAYETGVLPPELIPDPSDSQRRLEAIYNQIPIKPMSPTAFAMSSGGGSGVRLLAQPRAVASSALDIVGTVLANTNYVGPNNAGGHQGLYNDLTRVQKASQAVASDDGSDPAATVKLNTALAKALDQAIIRTDAIANRATETDASRQINAQMNAAFQQMRNQ